MSVVLVTGTSSGIGLETALAFARRGDDVYATMRDPGRGDELRRRARAEGLALVVLALDVTDDESVRAAVEAVERRHGALDVLVNNAGVDLSGPVETVAVERARAVVETNVWGPVRVARAVLPAMRARRSGLIVNVSSLGGRVPAMPYQGFYAASKRAIGALSESLAWELAPFGIRVVSIEPGFYATAIFRKSWEDAAGPDDPYAVDHDWVSRFFLQQGSAGAGDPAEVAEAIVRAARDPDTPVHRLVGDDAHQIVAAAEQAGDFEGWVATATAIMTSVAGPRPAPASPGRAGA